FVVCFVLITVIRSRKRCADNQSHNPNKQKKPRHLVSHPILALWSFDVPCYAAQRLPNGRWLIRAPTSNPVGPRVAMLPRPSRRARLLSLYGAAQMHAIVYSVNAIRPHRLFAD